MTEPAGLPQPASSDRPAHPVTPSANLSGAPGVEVLDAELVEGAARGRYDPRWEARVGPRPRRRRLPIVLFFLTCLSVFWAGIWRWSPVGPIMFFLGGGSELSPLGVDSDLQVRRLILHNGVDAAIYMAVLLAILMTHEMGHFLMSLRYRVAASWPFFLPLPISPVGTLGAVIGMDGRSADRKQIFDIGLAGPLAGLVIAIPALWIGVQKLDLTIPAAGPYALDLPLALRWAVAAKAPPGVEFHGTLPHSQLNPYFMAGWVGFLVTGLNMLPISQLDGGHVIYGLFGRRSRWIARAFLLSAILYIVLAGQYSWSVMLILILIMGTDHPPTRDDTVQLGWPRMLLGFASLAIPLLCFPPRVFVDN